MKQIKYNVEKTPHKLKFLKILQGRAGEVRGQGGQSGPGEGTLPKEGQLCTMGGTVVELDNRVTSVLFEKS